MHLMWMIDIWSIYVGCIFSFQHILSENKNLQQLFMVTENENRYIIWDALVVFLEWRFSFGGCRRDLDAIDRIREGLNIISGQLYTYDLSLLIYYRLICSVKLCIKHQLKLLNRTTIKQWH